MTKKIKEPVKPNRARVNKSFLTQMKEFRGGKSTPNEKVQLTSLKVKNTIQRMNLKAFNSKLTVAKCATLQKQMKLFVDAINEIID